MLATCMKVRARHYKCHVHRVARGFNKHNNVTSGCEKIKKQTIQTNVKNA